MASSSIFSTENQPQDFKEETFKNMLKFKNYHDLAEILEPHYKTSGSAFNLVKKDYQTVNQQLHNSMLSDETFAEDLSDNSPVDEEGFMSDEQMSEDEQPLDFSIKSKKEDNETKSTNNHSIFSTRSIDQVDGEFIRTTNLNSNNSKYHSTMFNSLNEYENAFQLYTNQLNSNKFNNLNGQNISASTVTNFNNNRYPFMNPLLLGESHSTNLIHSEPSSPEGLSSASSTSSRSSSQGYYSGSSLSGGTNGFNLPKTALNQNIVTSMYSSNLFNQSPNQTSSMNKSSPSYLQTAPPSYASLNFANNKSTFTRNSNGNNQQSRPSVIVSNSKIVNSNRLSASSPKNYNRDQTNLIEANSKLSYANDSDKIVDSIDEHFRLSLGSSYNKMLNSQSTPTKMDNTLKFSSLCSKKSSSTDDQIDCSLSQENSPSGKYLNFRFMNLNVSKLILFFFF